MTAPGGSMESAPAAPPNQITPPPQPTPPSPDRPIVREDPSPADDNATADQRAAQVVREEPTARPLPIRHTTRRPDAHGNTRMNTPAVMPQTKRTHPVPQPVPTDVAARSDGSGQTQATTLDGTQEPSTKPNPADTTPPVTLVGAARSRLREVSTDTHVPQPEPETPEPPSAEASVRVHAATDPGGPTDTQATKTPRPDGEATTPQVAAAALAKLTGNVIDLFNGDTTAADALPKSNLSDKPSVSVPPTEAVPPATVTPMEPAPATVPTTVSTPEPQPTAPTPPPEAAKPAVQPEAAIVKPVRVQEVPAAPAPDTTVAAPNVTAADPPAPTPDTAPATPLVLPEQVLTRGADGVWRAVPFASTAPTPPSSGPAAANPETVGAVPVGNPNAATASGPETLTPPTATLGFTAVQGSMTEAPVYDSMVDSSVYQPNGDMSGSIIGGDSAWSEYTGPSAAVTSPAEGQQSETERENSGEEQVGYVPGVGPRVTGMSGASSGRVPRSGEPLAFSSLPQQSTTSAELGTPTTRPRATAEANNPVSANAMPNTAKRPSAPSAARTARPLSRSFQHKVARSRSARMLAALGNAVALGTGVASIPRTAMRTQVGKITRPAGFKGLYQRTATIITPEGHTRQVTVTALTDGMARIKLRLQPAIERTIG